MKIKGDGHIGFYTVEEIQELFSEFGVQLIKSEISNMKFPFPPNSEYLNLFDSISNEEKALYNIYKKEDIVWIGNIDVANVLLEKN